METKLGLDQLSVDLYKGTGCVKDVSLDVNVIIKRDLLYYLIYVFIDEFALSLSLEGLELFIQTLETVLVRIKVRFIHIIIHNRWNIGNHLKERDVHRLFRYIHT